MLFTLALFLVAAFAGECPGGSDLGDTAAARMAKSHDYCTCAAIADSNACGLMQKVNAMNEENLCAVACAGVTAQTHVCSTSYMNANCAGAGWAFQFKLDNECEGHRIPTPFGMVMKYYNVLARKATCADASCTSGCKDLGDNNGNTAGTHYLGDCVQMGHMSYMKTLCSPSRRGRLLAAPPVDEDSNNGHGNTDSTEE